MLVNKYSVLLCLRAFQCCVHFLEILTDTLKKKLKVRKEEVENYVTNGLGVTYIDNG